MIMDQDESNLYPHHHPPSIGNNNNNIMMNDNNNNPHRIKLFLPLHSKKRNKLFILQ